MKEKICVVGAGIGGVVAAHTLNEMGHEVTVYEKEDRVGGKCFTGEYNEQYYEMGACSASPGFKTVLKLARKYKAKLQKRYSYYVIDKEGSKHSFRSQYWPWKKTPRILYEMTKYIYYNIKFAILYNRKATYLDMPAEYEATFMDFCKSKNLQIIPYWMELPVVSFGYGDLNEIKTWYVMDYINVINFIGMGILLILLGKSPVRKFEKGYGNLVQKIANDLDIKTNAEVKKIIRENNEVKVSYGNPGDNKITATETYDSIVIAVPIPDIAHAMDLSAEEEKLNQAVESYYYSIVCCRVLNFHHDNNLLRFNAREERFGHVALIEKHFKEEAEDLAVCYIPEKKGARPENEVLKRLKDDLKEVGAELGDIVYFKSWEYFSHFNDDNSYEILRGLQGKRNTCYVGGMTKFELAERVATESQTLVSRLFHGNYKKEWFTTIKNVFYYYFRSVPK